MSEAISTTALGKVVNEIKNIVLNSRQQAAAQVNIALLHTYWHIGRVIVEDEMKNQSRANYGAETLKILAKTLWHNPKIIHSQYSSGKHDVFDTL